MAETTVNLRIWGPDDITISKIMDVDPAIVCIADRGGHGTVLGIVLGDDDRPLQGVKGVSALASMVSTTIAATVSVMRQMGADDKLMMETLGEAIVSGLECENLESADIKVMPKGSRMPE